MEHPYLKAQDIEAIITARKFHAIPDTPAVVCQLDTIYGFSVYGVAPGPINPKNANFEVGCEIAFSKAFDQLWPLLAFHRMASAHTDVRPIQATEDMKLPDGSAVFQVINTVIDGKPATDMRGVLIGSQVFDPTNPAHRIMATINNQIDAIVGIATNSAVTRELNGDIDKRIEKTLQPVDDPVDDAVVHALPAEITRMDSERRLQEFDEQQQPQRPMTPEELAASQRLQQDMANAFGTEDHKGDANSDFELAPRTEGKGGNGLHREE